MNKNVITKMYAGSDKVELSEVSVELGIVDEALKDYAKYSKSQLQGNAKTDAVVNAAKQAIDLYNQALKDYALVVKQIEYIKTQAKDLGVDVPSQIKSLENEINSGIQYMNARISKLNTATQVQSK